MEHHRKRIHERNIYFAFGFFLFAVPLSSAAASSFNELENAQSSPGVRESAGAAMAEGLVLSQADAGKAEAAPSLREQYDQAYQDLLANLADPEKSFRFAELAVRIGDVSGAIAALERLLLLNPNLDNIRLELGVLYQRQGNNALAEAYLSRALQAPDMPSDVRERAEDYLKAAQRAQSRHQFSGFVSVGSQYYSNVNAAPTGNQVDVFDPFVGDTVQATLDPDSRKESDVNIFFSGGLTYAYDLETQAGDSIVANLFGFASRFADRSDFDLDFYEIDVGPRFVLGAGSQVPVGVRPYVTAEYVGLERDTLINALGGGLAFDTTLAEGRLLLEFQAQSQYQNFDNTTSRPVESFKTGTQELFVLGASYALTKEDLVGLEGAASVRSSKEDFESYQSYGTQLSYTRLFSPWFNWSDRSWSATLAGIYQYYGYDEPDPFVNPDKKRREDRWTARVIGEIPLIYDFNYSLLVEYTDNQSNLSNFRYDNWLVSSALTYRF